MNRQKHWRGAAAVAIAPPALWLVGKFTRQCLSILSLPRVESLAGDGFWLMVIVASMLASALAVGFVAAWCARAVGHASIRTLLTPSRAQLFGLLTAAALWLAIAGLYWEVYKQDDLLTAVWYILLGAANGIFGVVWLVLAARSAASLRQFRAGLLLLGFAAVTLAVAFTSYVLLMLHFEHAPPDPDLDLALFGLFALLLMGLYVLPPALASLGFAAVWGGVLSLVDRRGKGKGDSSSSGGE